MMPCPVWPQVVWARTARWCKTRVTIGHIGHANRYGKLSRRCQGTLLQGGQEGGAQRTCGRKTLASTTPTPAEQTSCLP